MKCEGNYRLKCVCPKSIFAILYPTPCQCDPIWKQEFCKCNEVLKKSYWTWMDPYPVTGVLKERGKIGHTQRSESPMMEAEVRVMRLQAKDTGGCRIPPETRSVARNRVSKGKANTLTLAFQPPDCKRTNFCCFNPRRLWDMTVQEVSFAQTYFFLI